MINADQIAPYAPVIIKLLQGVLYQEDAAAWDSLLHHQTTIRDYFGKIGLLLYLDEAEGYAFLRQADTEDEAVQALPRLVHRRKLSYPVTLLCVLLRENLQQFETSGTEAARLVVSAQDIYEMLQPYYDEQSDEAKRRRTFDSLINQAVDLGFLKAMRGQEDRQYEVRRILKAKLSADALADIKGKLESYVQSEK